MKQTIKVYTDGSWSSNKPGVSGWGYLVVLGDKIIHHQYGQAPGDSQQVGGELKAAMAGLLWAKKAGLKEVTICHDYTGVADWADGSWKPKKELPKKYVSFLQTTVNDLSITFEKIPAHAGDPFNELADKLAKKGVIEG